MAAEKRNKFREALIGGLIAILISPFTVMIGYKLNDYLSRASISIENIELKARRPTLPFPNDLFEPLNTRYANIFLIDFLDNYSTFAEDERRDLVSVSIGFERLDSRVTFRRHSINKKRQNLLISFFQDFINYCEKTEAIRAELSRRLKNIDNYDSMQEFLVGSGVENKVFYYKERHYVELPGITATQRDQDLADRLQSFVDFSSKITFDVKKRAEEILEYLKSLKPKRTGELYVNVVLLNSGNTDGLVKDLGWLFIKDSKHKIRIRASEMIKISRRSVVYEQYKADESLSEPAAYVELKNRVMQSNPSPIIIELEGTRKEKFAYTIHLPISD